MPPAKNEPDTRRVRFYETSDIASSEDPASAQNTHKKRESAAEQRKNKAKKMKDDRRALSAYESFFHMTPGTAELKDLEKSSARVAGWLTFADALDRIQDQQTQEDRARQEREQEARRNDWLERNGIMDQVGEHAAGMPSIGGACSKFGTLGPHLEPTISLMETSASPSSINVAENWVDIDIIVALDSGSQDHVCAEEDAPGYDLLQSEGSKSQQYFIFGDGGRLPNMGDKKLNLEPEDSANAISSCFQIARVTRPLMSVGRICDGGSKVVFEEDKATVFSREGNEICVFTRKPGGLYLCNMRLKQPFPRPE
jgi:hypothetical protein